MVAFASQFQPPPVEEPSRASRVDVRARIRVTETKNGLKIRVRGTVRLAENRLGKNRLASQKLRWEIRLLVEKCALRAPVHMNGRVYDYTIGRFASADPFIQDPIDSQSYNRYSYVLNNPLTYTDPSGYFSLKDIFKIVAVVAVGFLAAKFAIAKLGFTATTGAAGAGVGAGNVGVALFKLTGSTMVANGIIGGAAAGFAMGFSGSLLNGGSLGDAFKAGIKGGITGAFTGGALGKIGGMKLNSFQRGLAHGAVHGVAAEATGGEFRHGFLSGFANGSTDAFVAGLSDNEAVQVAVAAIVGGTSSALGGGKFANGAVSGAFSMMFNQQSQKARSNYNRDKNALKEAFLKSDTAKELWDETNPKLKWTNGSGAFTRGKKIFIPKNATLEQQASMLAYEIGHAYQEFKGINIGEKGMSLVQRVDAAITNEIVTDNYAQQIFSELSPSLTVTVPSYHQEWQNASDKMGYLRNLYDGPNPRLRPSLAPHLTYRQYYMEELR